MCWDQDKKEKKGAKTDANEKKKKKKKGVLLGAKDEGLRYLITLPWERSYSCLAPCKEKKDDKRLGPSPAEVPPGAVPRSLKFARLAEPPKAKPFLGFRCVRSHLSLVSRVWKEPINIDVADEGDVPCQLVIQNGLDDTNKADILAWVRALQPHASPRLNGAGSWSCADCGWVGSKRRV